MNENINPQQINKMLKQYPQKIPIILVNHNPKELHLEKNKFLVNKEYSLSSFMYILRKNAKIKENKGIIVIVNNILPPHTIMLWDLYEKYKNHDNILYLNLRVEGVFG